MILRCNTILAFFLISSSSITIALQECVETGDSGCPAIAPYSANCATQLNRKFVACCPNGATATRTPGDLCTLNDVSGNSKTETVIVSTESSVADALQGCFESGNSQCPETSPNSASCTSPLNREFDACCPDGATTTWTPGDQCTLNDESSNQRDYSKSDFSSYVSSGNISATTTTISMVTVTVATMTFLGL